MVLGAGGAPTPWRSVPQSSSDGGRCFYPGFGKCFAAETDRIADLRPGVVKMMLEAANTSARYWQSMPDEGTANSAFQVIENVRVPIHGMVIIMLAFVIVIGPVNLVVLAKLKRRTWLLWTIPAISFVTCLFVFAYSLLSEGITPDARIESLTLLDQGNRRAASVGTTAFYCPLTPSQGLYFGYETEATPLVQMFDTRSGSARQMDWTESQRLQRGWITARVPAHFRMRKSETRRERIQLDRAAGERTVMNGLGAPIRALWVSDSEGKVYSATGVPAGQTVTLTALAGRPEMAPGPRRLPSFLERPGTHPLDDFTMERAPSYLLPNTYIAELEGNPFLENGLGPKSKSSRTKARSVVYGVMETPEKP